MTRPGWPLRWQRGPEERERRGGGKRGKGEEVEEEEERKKTLSRPLDALFFSRFALSLQTTLFDLVRAHSKDYRGREGVGACRASSMRAREVRRTRGEKIAMPCPTLEGGNDDGDE